MPLRLAGATRLCHTRPTKDLEIVNLTPLAGLFMVALVAATVLPAQSEAVLAALVIQGRDPAWLLVAVASAGNILGSVLNWLLGRGIDRLRHRRWFPVSPAMIERAGRWYRCWGWPSLLLSWVPVVGDPLTVMAGALREPLWRFLLVVGLAKAARYTAVAALAGTWA